MLKTIVLAIAIAVAPSAAAQWASPVLHTRTLADAAFAIPTDLPDRPSVLVIGFTEASREQASAWSRMLARDGALGDMVTTYQVVVLDDVPGLVRRFVVGGIRRGVPESLHDRFLVVSDQADDWKALVSFAEPDVAYLVLLDGRGNPRWRGTGAPDAASLQALRRVASGL